MSLREKLIVALAPRFARDQPADDETAAALSTFVDAIMDEEAKRSASVVLAPEDMPICGDYGQEGMCTEPVGHKGDHVARCWSGDEGPAPALAERRVHHYSGGSVISTWPCGTCTCLYSPRSCAEHR